MPVAPRLVHVLVQPDRHRNFVITNVSRCSSVVAIMTSDNANGVCFCFILYLSFRKYHYIASVRCRFSPTRVDTKRCPFSIAITGCRQYENVQVIDDEPACFHRRHYTLWTNDGMRDLRRHKHVGSMERAIVACNSHSHMRLITSKV